MFSTKTIVTNIWQKNYEKAKKTNQLLIIKILFRKIRNPDSVGVKLKRKNITFLNEALLFSHSSKFFTFINLFLSISSAAYEKSPTLTFISHLNPQSSRPSKFVSLSDFCIYFAMVTDAIKQNVKLWITHFLLYKERSSSMRNVTGPFVCRTE